MTVLNKSGGDEIVLNQKLKSNIYIWIWIVDFEVKES